jgi:hypothetical protein
MPHPLHASAALGAGPTQSAGGPVRRRPTRSGRAAIGHPSQHQNLDGGSTVGPAGREIAHQALAGSLRNRPQPRSSPTRLQPRRSPASGRAAGVCFPAAAVARAVMPRVAPPPGPAAASLLDKTSRRRSGPAGGAAAARVRPPWLGEEMIPRQAGGAEGRHYDRDLGGQAERWRSRRRGRTRTVQRVRVTRTAADAPAAHPLLMPLPPARSGAETDCDCRVLARRLRKCARCQCGCLQARAILSRPPVPPARTDVATDCGDGGAGPGGTLL